MRIQFMGGADTVTGSRHLVRAAGVTLLRDMGMFQGRRAEAEEVNRRMPADPGSIDHVLVSHAHIDHCGMVPLLVARGYGGALHATGATAALCEIMLRDAAHIQESDAAYLNQKKNRANLPPVVPIFTKADAEKAIRLFRGHAYGESIDLAPGFRMTAFEAGHILGSALTLFELEEGGRRVRLGFAVDLGRYGLPLIRDPELMPDLDALVLESTYGNRLHDDAAHAEEQLHAIVKATLDRGGKVLIPSFALERAQELIFHLSSLIMQGRLPHVPVYLDSPMAGAVAKVFDDHPHYLDEESQRHFARAGCLTCPSWVRVSESVDQSKAITASDAPCIVIAASGMCEHGRILHHLKHGIGSERNSVVLVGYQASHTLGRRIQEGEDRVRIFGDWFEVRAEVTTLHAFSGHADRNDLVRYASATGAKRIFLVHGERDQREALAEALEKSGHRDVILPATGDEVEL